MNSTFGSGLLRQAAEEKIIKIGKNKEKRCKSNAEPSLLGLCRDAALFIQKQRQVNEYQYCFYLFLLVFTCFFFGGLPQQNIRNLNHELYGNYMAALYGNWWRKNMNCHELTANIIWELHG
jgi:hypothetical protein